MRTAEQKLGGTEHTDHRFRGRSAVTLPLVTSVDPAVRPRRDLCPPQDLTQQHVSDETSVRLTERCARLHVFCAARLAHETLPVFDANINTENLTKCLQSLKEMYADVARDGGGGGGGASPNEAEFRAYVVLMNLNEGDTLRSVRVRRGNGSGAGSSGVGVEATRRTARCRYRNFQSIGSVVRMVRF